MKLIKNKNGDFKIEEINFRRSYIEQLTKFFQSGIFDIYVPIEVDDEEKIVRTSININQKQLDEYIERLNKEFEVEFYEVFPENMNGKPKIVELKLNKEKQKLIRLVAVKSDKKFSKSKEEKVKILVRYFETLSVENKLKLFIIVLESDMIKLKIDKENLIELLKNFLCVFDKNYNKNRMVTLEYNIDVFILSKVMEMNKTEKESFNSLIEHKENKCYKRILSFIKNIFKRQKNS